MSFLVTTTVKQKLTRKERVAKIAAKILETPNVGCEISSTREGRCLCEKISFARRKNGLWSGIYVWAHDNQISLNLIKREEDFVNAILSSILAEAEIDDEIIPPLLPVNPSKDDSDWCFGAADEESF